MSSGVNLEIARSNASIFSTAMSNDLVMYHFSSNASINIGILGSSNTVRISSNATTLTGPLVARSNATLGGTVSLASATTLTFPQAVTFNNVSMSAGCIADFSAASNVIMPAAYIALNAGNGFNGGSGGSGTSNQSFSNVYTSNIKASNITAYPNGLVDFSAASNVLMPAFFMSNLVKTSISSNQAFSNVTTSNVTASNFTAFTNGIIDFSAASSVFMPASFIASLSNATNASSTNASSNPTFCNVTATGVVDFSAATSVRLPASFSGTTGTTTYSSNPTFSNVVASNVTAPTGSFSNVVASNVTAITVTLSNVTASNITATLGAFSNINAASNVTAPTGSFSNVTASNITATLGAFSNINVASNVTAPTGSFSNLTASNMMAITATFSNITSSNERAITATFSNVYTSNVAATLGTFSNVTTSNVMATLGTFSNITMSNVTAMVASFSNMTTSNITTPSAAFSNVTASNVVAMVAAFSNVTASNVTSTLGAFSNITTSNVTSTTAAFSNITTSNITSTLGAFSNVTTSNLATSNLTFNASLSTPWLTFNSGGQTLTTLGSAQVYTSNMTYSNLATQTINASAYALSTGQATVQIISATPSGQAVGNNLTLSNLVVASNVTASNVTASNVTTSNATFGSLYSSNMTSPYATHSNIYSSNISIIAPLAPTNPNVPMTWWTTPSTNGTFYVASASGEINGNYAAFRAFDNVPWTYWQASSSAVYSTAGAYIGANTTPYNNNLSNASGEWLQIELPNGILATSVTITSSNISNILTTPAKVIMLGSSDGINWKYVASNNTPNTNTTFTLTPLNDGSISAANMFRFVTLSNGSASAPAIISINIAGNPKPITTTDTGAVGIGVDQPIQALEVAGNMVCSGNISANNLGTFRNYLINGGMVINQRGITAQAIPTGTQYPAPYAGFIADRWLAYRDNWAAGGTMSNLTCSTSDLPFIQDGITNYARIGRSDGGLFGINIIQHLETINSKPLAGKSVTLSFYARKGSTFSSSIGIYNRVWCGFMVDKNLPVDGMGSGATNNENLSNLTQVWQKYTFTTRIPLLCTQIAVSFNYIPTNGVASANDYFDITGVQLEKGTIATPFEYRPFAMELQLCQRYFEKSYPYSLAPGTSATYTSFQRFKVPIMSIDPTGAFFGFAYKVTKRAPNNTVTLYLETGAINRLAIYATNNTAYNTSLAQSSTSVIEANTENEWAVIYTGLTSASWGGGLAIFHWTCTSEL